MKKLGKVLLSSLFCLSLVGCGSSSSSSSKSTLEQIKEDGVLKVGVKDDRIGFGLKNTKTGEYEGYEIELADMLAKELIGKKAKVEYTAVDAKTRTGLLDNKEIDCVIATFTITDERKESWNFSNSYYRDNVGILAKKGKYSSLKDMDGATVAVQQSSTSKEALEEAASKVGVKLNYKEFASAPECVSAVNSGATDAYSIDVTCLMSYLNDDLEILPDRFSPQDFGIATRKDDKELAKKINKFIKELKDDGTLDKLQKKYNIAQEE